MENLKPYQDNTFDTETNDKRLQPVAAGCRLCTKFERHHHSFIGEIGTRRWDISHNKGMMCGAYLFWICDIKSTSKILEYNGPIHTMRRLC